MRGIRCNPLTVGRLAHTMKTARRDEVPPQDRAHSVGGVVYEAVCLLRGLGGVAALKCDGSERLRPRRAFQAGGAHDHSALHVVAVWRPDAQGPFAGYTERRGPGHLPLEAA